MRSIRRLCAAMALVLAACAAPEVPPAPTPTPLRAEPIEAPPAPLPPRESINLDAETQALVAQARRAIFLIPFTHWDTDWHNTFERYAAAADRNIADAIQLAKRYPRFRYTIEQALFAQHFWERYPARRADLKALVQKRQITFAWPGVTQPETSLVAPTVQVANLQLGQEWIERTFGVRPRAAWQSDAFGNSAALPIFLARSGIPYVYMGRGRGVCEQQFRCQRALPPAFYWASPADPTQHVLATYLFYSDAFGATAQFTDTIKQIPELRKVVEREFAYTSSRYLFLPFGADFSSPLPGLPALVDAWNAADRDTVLVMADPETAFQYLATQNLPEFTTDLNPIWQAFYGTRPDAKIADKESEYYLTAADKFGLLLDDGPRSSAWYTATINAHYDNIAGVSFDRVWEASQRPRFEQAVAGAADDLSRTLARIAASVPAPLLVFNPASWPRSGVVEIQGDLPDLSALPTPAQRLGPDAVAFWAEDVPPVGYMAPTITASTIIYPATIEQIGQTVTLKNGLVAVTLDGARGGAFSSIAFDGGPELLAAPGDDVTYLDDNGDVYGSFFGAKRARESRVPARLTVLADGPLVARAQVSFALDGQPITKTVTLYADSPRIDVALQIAALPQTTAIVQTPTSRDTPTRTDDLGFAALGHPVDDSPIVSGTITYRREVFYPIIAWADVSASGAGLSLITHGLQGLGGTRTLNLLLVRQVSDNGREGVTDAGYHTLRYAYLPHAGAASEAQPWLAAYAFNQPLIPVWRVGEEMRVQLPFAPAMPPRSAGDRVGHTLPASLSLIAAGSAIVADLYRHDDHVEAVILDYDPATPATITSGPWRTTLPPAALATTTVEVHPQ